MILVPKTLADIRPPEAIAREIGACACHQVTEAGRSAARVYYIDKGEGLYLKADAKGALANHARMQAFLCARGLAPAAIAYESEAEDWLLSRRARGADATQQQFLRDPERLAQALGCAARLLHSLPARDCPGPDQTPAWIDAHRRAAAQNRPLDKDASDFLGLSSPEEAARIAREGIPRLAHDCVVHGDLCLPNFMLDNFAFTGFIDLAGAGLGDRHYDLFWCLWSLAYNLKTNAYGEAFLTAYGKADADPARIRACGCLCALKDAVGPS